MIIYYVLSFIKQYIPITNNFHQCCNFYECWFEYELKLKHILNYEQQQLLQIPEPSIKGLKRMSQQHVWYQWLRWTFYFNPTVKIAVNVI